MRIVVLWAWAGDDEDGGYVISTSIARTACGPVSFLVTGSAWY